MDNIVDLEQMDIDRLDDVILMQFHNIINLHVTRALKINPDFEVENLVGVVLQFINDVNLLWDRLLINTKETIQTKIKFLNLVNTPWGLLLERD